MTFRNSQLKLPYVETPLIPSLYLSEVTGAQVYLKLEMVQPSGSFKSRGLGNLVYQTIVNAPPGTDLHFFSPSGGNAGCGTAYAARQYGKKCTVCLPTISNPTMVERIRKTGARVVIHGKTIAEADHHLRTVLMPNCKERAVYCHPYNDPVVWEGNSSLATELVKQYSDLAPYEGDSDSEGSDLSLPDDDRPLSRRPDAVICSCGGGGLYNGLVQGFDKTGWHDVPIVAVETEGCAALNQSLAAGGEQIQIETPSTIATSLSTMNVTKETIANAMRTDRKTYPVQVSDADAAASCIYFARDHKLLIEAACGTALAPLYNGKIKEILPNLNQDSTLVVIICGGTSVTWDILMSYSKTFNVPL